MVLTNKSKAHVYINETTTKTVFMTKAHTQANIIMNVFKFFKLMLCKAIYLYTDK